MKRVDHVYIIQVCRSCLVGQIYRMLQWDVPDREGLKLRVTRRDSPFMLMVELGEAGSHLSAAGARSCDNHQGPLCFNVFIFAVSVVAYDQWDVGG